MTEREAILRLIRTKRIADGGIPLVSCQGQGMDGYSELAEYRYIIDIMDKSLLQKKETND